MSNPKPALWPPLTVVPESGATVKRIFLCRHGETEANAKGVLQGIGNISINYRGQEQARALRDQLKMEEFDLIVSSKLARAIETADIVAENHPSAERIVIEELAEINWGEWEGGSSPLLSDLLSDWHNGKYSSKAPIGESPIEVERRAVPALYDFILKNTGKNILFVIHGRLLRIILSSIIYRSLEHMSDFTHQNCCINVLDVILDTEKSVFGTRYRMDPHHILGTHTSQLTATDEESKLLSGSTSNLESGSGPLTVANILISHPGNLTFVPIALDDRRHLKSLDP